MDKRGFELAVGTVVIMILAIAVLLFLISFFVMGSGDFLSKIKGYFSYSNLDSVKQSCDVLADSGQEHNFCCDAKTVRYYESGEKIEDEMSCGEMAEKGIIKLNGINCETVDC